MKQKILMLLAAVLLSSASAFAQSGDSEPLKGDVNGDGKVDVADIVAIIEIMKNNGGTDSQAQYWYVGVTDPTTLNIGETKSELDKWTATSTNISDLYVHAEDPEVEDYTWYVAVPTSWGLTKMWDMVGTTEVDKTDYTVSTSSISNINYTIFKYNSVTDSIYNHFK